MKHEKGPWKIEQDSWLEDHVTINAPGHGALAHVVWQMKDDRGHSDDFAGSDTCRANAHLIAAAPDLLEAVEMAQSALRNWAALHPEDVDAIDVMAKNLINKALKKAKGMT